MNLKNFKSEFKKQLILHKFKYKVLLSREHFIKLPEISHITRKKVDCLNKLLIELQTSKHLHSNRIFEHGEKIPLKTLRFDNRR